MEWFSFQILLFLATAWQFWFLSLGAASFAVKNLLVGEASKLCAVTEIATGGFKRILGTKQWLFCTRPLVDIFKGDEPLGPWGQSSLSFLEGAWWTLERVLQAAVGWLLRLWAWKGFRQPLPDRMCEEGHSISKARVETTMSCFAFLQISYKLGKGTRCGRFDLEPAGEKVTLFYFCISAGRREICPQ